MKFVNINVSLFVTISLNLISFVQNAEATQIPNILFIMADDQDLLMNSMNYMPKVNNLIGKNGTTFLKHYCTNALCCPSRSSLLTGKCVHNTNVTNVVVPYGGYPKFITQGLNNDYLPLWLQDGGINTYYVGKFVNGHDIDNYQTDPVRGWTSSNFLLEPGTYDYTNTTWTLNNQDWVSYPGQNAVNLTTKNALDMLEVAATSGKPFFLIISPAIPHVGINASQPGLTFNPIPQDRYANAFPDAIVPRTPNWNPTTPSGVSWVSNLFHQNESFVNALDELYRARIRCVAGLDDMVSDLISVLEKYGILENTHVIYTTDNGYHISQHRMGGGKKTGFETDINIPLLWRGPGVPAGKVSSLVSTHTDLAPTFLNLFGLPLRTDFDGQFIPVSDTFSSTTDQSTEHVNIEMWAPAEPYEVTPFSSIDIKGERNNTYKGLRIISSNYSFYYSVWCTNEHELYDMEADQYQMNNLLPSTFNIADVSSTTVLLSRPLVQVVARLDALMMVLKSCVGNECVQPWLQLHPQGNVNSLLDALNPQYDSFYQAQPKVSFSKCMTGYIVEYEGPQTAMVYNGS